MKWIAPVFAAFLALVPAPQRPYIMEGNYNYQKIAEHTGEEAQRVWELGDRFHDVNCDGVSDFIYEKEGRIHLFAGSGNIYPNRRQRGDKFPQRFEYKGVIADLGREAAFSEDVTLLLSDRYVHNEWVRKAGNVDNSFLMDILVKQNSEVLVYRDVAEFKPCQTND